ncbi:MAG: WbqC family protein [Chitinophagaceae bacterium]|nr:WbqC family protein [Chitinophagaceae bacterium]
MNLAAIMQPTFFPWMGYFDIIDQVDIFVFYDNVQLTKRSWQVRNRIKMASGEYFLTVPVKKTKNRDELMICDAEICYEQHWQAKHLKNIEINYKKSAHFNEVFGLISEIYGKKHNLLYSFNEDFIINVLKRIGITTTLVQSHELGEVEGVKDARLAAICKKIGCGDYLSPQGSSNYIEAVSPGGELVRQGIALYYQHYVHPVYHQLYGSFHGYLGIIDLLFNEGFDNALGIIRSGRHEKIPFMDFRTKYLKLENQ